MKKLLAVICVCVVIVPSVLAQIPAVPEKFTYQGVVRDNLGEVIANHVVNLKLSIMDGGPNGFNVYSERQTVVTNEFGLFSIEVGGSSLVLSGDFSAIDWDSNVKYLRVEMDLNGFTNWTHMGTSQILSVPFALSSKVSADNKWIQDVNTIYPIQYTRVGIGTTVAVTPLHVHDSPVLFTGSDGSTPISGAGRRLMWVPEKAAFRVGAVTGVSGMGSLNWDDAEYWDDANIGAASFASGIFTRAKGAASTAMGRSARADGDYSLAIGYNIQATGEYSVVIGSDAVASGRYAKVFGRGGLASGEESMVLGPGTASGIASYSIGGGDATANGSITIGDPAEAEGVRSLAIGNQVHASGVYSMAMGFYSDAIGNQSISMGTYTNAPSFAEVVVGRNNTIYTPISATEWWDDDRLFVVGNGSGSRSDAMVILKNGNIGIGFSSPLYKLHVNGDAAKPGGGSWITSSDKRLKQNVKPYTDGLDMVMAINPVSYQYTKESGYNSQPEYVGVIAQDLKEVAHYMVGSFKKDGEEYLSVDNSAMMYMLINGMKEQQALIEALQAEIKELKKTR